MDPGREHTGGGEWASSQPPRGGKGAGVLEKPAHLPPPWKLGPCSAPPEEHQAPREQAPRHPAAQPGQAPRCSAAHAPYRDENSPTLCAWARGCTYAGCSLDPGRLALGMRVRLRGEGAGDLAKRRLTLTGCVMPVCPLTSPSLRRPSTKLGRGWCPLYEHRQTEQEEAAAPNPGAWRTPVNAALGIPHRSCQPSRPPVPTSTLNDAGPGHHPGRGSGQCARPHSWSGRRGRGCRSRP